jgi:hypothetical protein
MVRIYQNLYEAHHSAYRAVKPRAIQASSSLLCMDGLTITRNGLGLDESKLFAQTTREQPGQVGFSQHVPVRAMCITKHFVHWSGHLQLDRLVGTMRQLQYCLLLHIQFCPLSRNHAKAGVSLAEYMYDLPSPVSRICLHREFPLNLTRILHLSTTPEASKDDSICTRCCPCRRWRPLFRHLGGCYPSCRSRGMGSHQRQPQ